MNIDYKKVIEVFIKELCEDMSYYPTKYSIQINSYADKKNIKFLNQLIERYSSIIMLNSTNALAYYKRGYVFFKKKQYRKAIEDFSKSIDLNKNFVYSYISRGESYFNLKEVDLAEQDFKQVIEFSTNLNHKIYIRLGNVMIFQSRFNDAIEYFTKAIKLDSNIGLAFYGRAMAYRMVFEYEKAISDFTKAIELNPRNRYAFTNRGITYYIINDLDKSLYDFNEALKLKIEDIFTLNNRGIVYRKKLEQNLAEQDFEKAIELCPEDSYGYYNLANLYWHQNLEDKALKFYYKATELDFSFVLPYIARANIFLSKNDLQKAFEEVYQAIEIMPDNSVCYLILGYINLLKQNYKDSLDNFDFAIKNDTYKRPELFYAKGLAFFMLKDFSSADNFFSRALDLSFEKIELLYAKAKSLFNLEKYTQAIEILSEIINKNSNIAESYYTRGLCYIKEKKYEDALNDFSKSIEFEYCIAESSFYLSLCNIYFKRYNVALENIDKAISLGYKNTDVLLNRDFIIKNLNLQKQTKTYTKQNFNKDEAILTNKTKETLNIASYDEAEKNISKTLKAGTENIETKISRAKEKLLEKDYEQCIKISTEVLDEVLDRDKANIICLELRAQAFVLSNNLIKALKDYTKLIEYQPSNVDLYLKRINLYINMKLYQKALDDADFVISMDKNNVCAYFYKGIVYRNTDKLIDAIKNYDIALKILIENKFIKLDSSFLDLKKYFCLNNKKENSSQNIEKNSVDTDIKEVLEEKNINNISENKNLIVKEIEKENKFDKNKKIQIIKNGESKDISEPNSIEGIISVLTKDNNNVSYYKKRAELYIKESKYKEAIVEYDIAINLSNKDIELYIGQTKAYKGLKKYQEAMSIIDKAIKIDVANADLYYEKALLFQKLGDDKNYLKNIETALDYDPEHKLACFSRVYYFFKQSQFVKAYQIAMSIIDFTSDTENKYLLAKICFNLKKYKDAIVLLKQIYEYKKQEKEIDFYVGISLSKTNNINEAGPYLINSVNNGVSDKDVFYFLAQFYYDKQNYELALENIEKSLALISTDYKLYWLKAKIYFKLNDFTKSFQNFDEAIKLNPEDRDLLISKIEYLEKNNKISECINGYSTIISSSKQTDGLLYFKRALLYKKAKNIEYALKDFLEAKKLGLNVEKEIEEINNIILLQKEKQLQAQEVEKIQKQNQTQKEESKQQINNEVKNIRDGVKEENVKIDTKASAIYLARANINFKNNKYDVALSDITEAIKYNPKDTQGYLLRAKIYIQIRKEDIAIKDLLKAIELSPQSVLPYIEIADIYRLKNNFDESESYYQKAIKINSKNATAYFGYAMLCEQNGKKDMAIQNYQEASKFDIKLSKECGVRIKKLKS